MDRTPTFLLLALLIPFLCAGPTNAFAQPNTAPPGFTVTTLGPFTALDRRVHGLLEQQLAARGLSETLGRWMLLFDVEEIDRAGAKDVVLSVVAMSGLPEDVIALGSEEEVFYLAAARDRALPAEGRRVRQFVSEDWLRQFYAVRGQYMRVVPAAQVERACASIVEALAQEPWFARIR